MAITDLTGYTWVGNDTINITSSNYLIGFVSTGITYNAIYFTNTDYGDGNPVKQLMYGSNIVYSGSWQSDAYKTIEITGGTDATNSTLIAWLEANGTLIPAATPSIADKLLAVNQIKQDIKTAIENKGSVLTGVDFGGYAEKIDLLPLPKEEQTKTVSSPNFSSGNVVVTPDTGKVLTQVTVVKDNDLIPENIVKDVNIFGVVGTTRTGVELTQAMYDALSVYDDNTYYLIVEIEI